MGIIIRNMNTATVLSHLRFGRKVERSNIVSLGGTELFMFDTDGNKVDEYVVDNPARALYVTTKHIYTGHTNGKILRYGIDSKELTTISQHRTSEILDVVVHKNHIYSLSTSKSTNYNLFKSDMSGTLIWQNVVSTSSWGNLRKIAFDSSDNIYIPNGGGVKESR